MLGESHPDDDIYQLMVLNDQQYALPVHCIISVLAQENLLWLPGTPRWVGGVVNIRNAIVPVINLNELIDSGSAESQSSSPLLILVRHPLDSGRWLALCITDLNNILLKDELDNMPASLPVHQCLVKVVEHKSQKIHLLDINRLFQQLMQGQDA